MTEFEVPLKSKLDWSRLLGFSQAARHDGEAAVQRLADPRMAKLGSKQCIKAVGGERAQRLSDPRMAKLGSKIGTKIGVKRAR